MKPKNYLRIAASLFLLVALIHLVRILSGFSIEILGEKYPLWLSWAEMLIGFFLSYQGFKLARKM